MSGGPAGLELVLGHRIADLDALGAMVGAALLERAEGRAPQLVAPDGLAPKASLALRRLGEAAPRIAPEGPLLAEAERRGVRRAVVVDTARAERLGRWAPLVAGAAERVAIDTHPAQADDLPRDDGPAAASAAAVVALRIHARGLRPSPAEASLMLLGIHEDSGHFSFPSTSEADHEAAARCLAWGASLALVAEVLPRGMRGAATEAEGQGTPVRDRMVRDFVGCAADETVAAVLQRVHRARINALPVREGAHWTTQISRAELEAALRHGLGGRPVGELACQPLQWIGGDQPVAEANLALSRARGRVFMVGTAPDRPEGLITRTTLLLAQAERIAPPSRRPPDARLVLGMLRKALGPEAARVEALGALAAELGLGCFLVGGPVRDLLLGRPVRDIDLLVEGPGGAPALARAAQARFGGEVVHHDAFLTSKWRPPTGASLDLATARAERYAAVAALPEVQAASVEQDLVRRDFTLNALAVELSPGRLGRVLDPFGGWADLQDRVLRVLHGLSFHDDPTRALRAARFAARFDLRLAPGTRGLLGGLIEAGSFARLGLERLGHELALIFNEALPERALRLLDEWGLLRALHPELRPSALDLERLRAGLDRLDPDSPDRARLGWLWLSGGLPPAGRGPLDRMIPGDRRERRRFVAGPARLEQAGARLLRAGSAAAAGSALSALDPIEITLLDANLAVTQPEGDARRGWLAWWRAGGQACKTTVRGEQLLGAGLSPGPAIKVGLEAAQAAAWEGMDGEAQRTAALEAARAFSRRGDPDPRAAEG